MSAAELGPVMPDGPAAPPAGPVGASPVEASPATPGTADRGRWDAEADGWLVAQAVSGASAALKVQAFEVLLRRHQDRIYRIALRMTGDPTEAEDVAQDVAVQLWRMLASFTGASMFTTWLYRLVVNRCLNHQRSRRVRGRDTVALLEVDHPHAGGPEQRVLDAAQVDAAAAALAGLPADQRAAVVLCQIEGLSYREAAAISNISEGALRSRLERGRHGLLAAMRGWA